MTQPAVVPSDALPLEDEPVIGGHQLRRKLSESLVDEEKRSLDPKLLKVRSRVRRLFVIRRGT